MKKIRKEIIYFILSLLFVHFFTGCVSLSECPYKILLEQKSFSSLFLDNNMNLDFSVINKSQKDICSFSVIFSLFNSDGEPVFYSDSIKIDFQDTIPSGKEKHFLINFVDYINLDLEEIYIIDYIYITNIKFYDDSVWVDEFGIFSED